MFPRTEARNSPGRSDAGHSVDLDCVLQRTDDANAHNYRTASYFDPGEQPCGLAML